MRSCMLLNPPAKAPMGKPCVDPCSGPSYVQNDAAGAASVKADSSSGGGRVDASGGSKKESKKKR